MPRLPPVLLLVNEVADRAVLVGDPGRALALAPVLLTKPLMSNHQRGLWGYTGTAADGLPLTIQATGVGGPSAAGVVAELAAAGVRRMVRAGTAVGVPEPVPSDELRTVERAVSGDGASRALGADGAVLPDAGLLARLLAHAPVGTGVLSVDLPPDDPTATVPEDVGAVDLQTAAVLQAAARHGVAAAAVLAFPSGADDDAARERWTIASGTAAAAALGATG